MKNKIAWLGMAGLLTVNALGLQAAVIVDFKGTASSVNGFYSWSDTNNWVGGVLPATTDNARFRYADSENKAYLEEDAQVSSLNLNAGIHAELAGKAIIEIDSYLNFTATTATNRLAVHDNIIMEVGNRMRFKGGRTEINLYDDSILDTQVSFDEAGSEFVVNLYDNASYTKLISPLSAGNISNGHFVLNECSSVIANMLTAQELYDHWMVYGTTFHLNDGASIIFQTSASNPSDIEAYIAAGYLKINGSSNAVSNVDYTYDAVSGVLKAYSGRLHFQALDEIAPNTVLTAKLNGVTLEPSPDVGEIFESNQPQQMVGTSTNTRAWKIPATLLTDGSNTVTVTSSSSSTQDVTAAWVDIMTY